MWKFIISFILIILGLLFIKTLDWKKKYKFYLSRFEKTNDHLLDNLLKKYDLLVKQVGLFKNKKKLKEEDYQEFLNINKKEIKVKELDQIIEKYENKLNLVLQNNEKLVKEHAIKKNINEIEKINVNITGIKKYYNNMSYKYNRYLKKFPTSIIGKIYKYKENELYDIKEEKLKVLDN